MMKRWQSYAIVIGVVGGSLGILGTLETLGLRWWAWSWEISAVAAEAKTIGERQRVLEEAWHVRDQIDIKFRLRDLRQNPELNNDQFLQSVERDLEAQLLQVTRQLEKLGK